MKEEVVYGSDVIVAMLKEMNIEYAAFNPGASFRGLHDSLVHYGGDKKVEIIQCCHEEISVALAHGYAKATGQPMAAILHDVVGLQHASMAIFNAWCDRVPILLLGGTGPMDAARRRPTIDWVHTALVQGNQIRDYVKWDDQPYSVASVPTSLLRGYRTAVTPPQGPVYVCFDVCIQEDEVEESVALPKMDAYALPTSPAPEPGTLETIARELCDAKFPLVVSDYVGRDRAAVDSLQTLAEMLSMPVVDAGKWHRSVIFPNTHPLDITGAGKDILSGADAILGIEVDDLYGTLQNISNVAPGQHASVPSEKKVFHIGLKDLQGNKWVTTEQELQPTHASITADPGIALHELVAICKGLLKEAPLNEAREARAKEFAEMHENIRAAWYQEMLEGANEKPIAVPWLAEQVWQEIKATDWVITNGTLKGWARRLWDWDDVDRFIGVSGGAGLGYGIGASLGVALAYKDTGKVCVDLQDDGDFLFAPSALWTAAHYKLPLLVIINNNGTYYNADRHQWRVGEARNRDLEKVAVGTALDNPRVDYSMLARAFGIYAEGPITEPQNVRESIKRAIEVVEKKQCPAVVDVVTAPIGK